MSREIGLRVKEGHEERILDLMIPYIRDSYAYYTGIMAFLTRVREHIDRCTSLTSLETVETALKSSKFDQAYAYCKIKEQTTREENMADANKDHPNQPLQKNLVPTKEEGIAIPMNQIKQEKRECGDTMEIEEKETDDPLEPAGATKRKYGKCLFLHQRKFGKGWRS